MTGLPDSGDAEHRVTTVLVRLLLLRNGSLWHNPLVDAVLRGALLIDWALSGRLVETDDDFELDTTPSGNPAADALLGRIAAEPDCPLTGWLRREQPTLAELVEPLVATGVLVPTSHRWPRKDGYRDPRGAELPALRRRLCDVIVENQPGEAELVALAVLAQLVGVLGITASAAGDDVVRQAGGVSWLLMAIRDFGAERLTYLSFRSSRSFTTGGSG